MTPQPWWEDFDKMLEFLRTLESTTGLFGFTLREADIARAAARRAVEGHGHVAGCDCHQAEALCEDLCAEGVPHPVRDPRCLPWAGGV